MDGHVARRLVVRRGSLQKQPPPQDGVRLHVTVLLVIELARLLQDAVRDGHLADVMQHGSDAELVALADALGVVHLVDGRPAVVHGHGAFGHALDVGTGLGGVAHLGGGDGAHDDAADKLGTLERQRCHAREELHRRLVGRGVGGRLAGHLAAAARIDELQDADDLVARIAQRRHQHAPRRVADLQVEIAPEVVWQRRVERVDILDAERLAGHRHVAGDGVGVARDANVRQRQALARGELRFKRVVLRVDEAQAVGLAHPDGSGVGIREAARQAQRLVHDFVEILRAAELRAQRSHFGDALALFLALLAQEVVHGRQLAVGGVHLGVAAHQLGLALRKRAHGLVAVALRTTHAGVVADARHQFERVRQLHQVVVGTELEAALLGLRHRVGGEHHERHVGEVGVGADALDLLHPVHAGHHQVLQHDVGAARKRQSVSRVRVALGNQLQVGEVRQQPTQRRLDDRLIVDEQDKRLGCRGFRGSVHARGS